jgi:cobyrinic acid a,c-diamide synthase
MPEIPRILFTAPYSAGGKTTFACGFMRVLQNRGLVPAAFKCGPDYVDAAYHKATMRVETANIDLFFCGGPDLVRGLVAQGSQGADVAVIEGVMGYYDGAGGLSPTSSTWDMATQLEAPAVLILYAYGITQTASALALGLDSFRRPSRLAGVILNCCRPTLHQKLAPLIEKDTGLPVLGYLPPRDDYGFRSRNLGLYMPGELDNFEARIEALARQMEETLDIEALLRIARAAPPLPEGRLPELGPPLEPGPVIAVARDKAFSFYYDENLSLMRRLGARLLPFSPLSDAALPPGISGLYLGGGYIEVHAEELAANASMRQSILEAFNGGLPTIAEGGGFLYLQESLLDENDQARPMVGALPGLARKGDKRARFGYITVTAKKDNLLCAKGESIAAHEFHEWDSDYPGGDFQAQKPADDRNWLCAQTGETYYAGFPQMYFYNNPDFLRRFLKKATEYRV